MDNTIKVKEILGWILSPCKKYKLVHVKIKDDDVKVITRSDALLKNGSKIKARYVAYNPLFSSIIREVFISVDDIDEWICEEYGQIIAKYFFEFEAFDNKHIYVVTCIDGDSKKTAICLTETDAIAMFYSECMDREIAYDFTHDEFNPHSYENDDEDRFIKIWIDRCEINKWEKE